MSKYPTFNDVPAKDVEDLREIAAQSPVLAARQLRRRVEKYQLHWAEDFIRDVVLGGEDAAHWGFRSRLCFPSQSVAELITQSLEVTLDGLIHLGGTSWVRHVPSMDAWSSAAPSSGAPAVLVENTPYWFCGPPGTDCTTAAAAPLEAIPDITIAARRWIASRAAFLLRQREAIGATPAQVAHALGVDGTLSDDGTAALAALLQERAYFGMSHLPLGFRGPDSWYLSATPSEVVLTSVQAASRGLPPVDIRFDLAGSGLGVFSAPPGFYCVTQSPPGDWCSFSLWPAEPDVTSEAHLASSIDRMSRGAGALDSIASAATTIGGSPALVLCGFRGSDAFRSCVCAALIPYAHGAVVAEFVLPAGRRTTIAWSDILSHERLGGIATTLRVAAASQALAANRADDGETDKRPSVAVTLRSSTPAEHTASIWNSEDSSPPSAKSIANAEFPIGSKVADTSYLIVEHVCGEPTRGLYRGVNLFAGGEQRVLITTTGAQARTPTEIASTLRFAHPLFTPLRHVGTLAGHSGAFHALVEDEPDGRPTTDLRLPMPTSYAIGLVAELAAILAPAHSAGTVLTYLRPELVYVTSSSLGLSIRGISVRPDAFASAAEPVSSGTGPLFEHLHCAPEVLRLSDTITPAADVFSLCSMLTLWITGRSAFANESLQAQLMAVMSGQRRPWSGPPVLEPIVADGLSTDPACRPSLDALMAQLTAAI